MKEMSPLELKERLNDRRRPFVLDVRQPEELAEGRIPGAVMIPLGELPHRFDELDPSDEIVVHCRGGGRSARAVQFLEAQGFANVANLAGGIMRWNAEAGSATQRGSPGVQSSQP